MPPAAAGCSESDGRRKVEFSDWQVLVLHDSPGHLLELLATSDTPVELEAFRRQFEEGGNKRRQVECKFVQPGKVSFGGGGSGAYKYAVADPSAGGGFFCAKRTTLAHEVEELQQGARGEHGPPQLGLYQEVRLYPKSKLRERGWLLIQHYRRACGFADELLRLWQQWVLVHVGAQEGAHPDMFAMALLALYFLRHESLVPDLVERGAKKKGAEPRGGRDECFMVEGVSTSFDESWSWEAEVEKPNSIFKKRLHTLCALPTQANRLGGSLDVSVDAGGQLFCRFLQFLHRRGDEQDRRISGKQLLSLRGTQETRTTPDFLTCADPFLMSRRVQCFCVTAAAANCPGTDHSGTTAPGEAGIEALFSATRKLRNAVTAAAEQTGSSMLASKKLLDALRTVSSSSFFDATMPLISSRNNKETCSSTSSCAAGSSRRMIGGKSGATASKQSAPSTSSNGSKDAFYRGSSSGCQTSHSKNSETTSTCSQKAVSKDIYKAFSKETGGADALPTTLVLHPPAEQVGPPQLTYAKILHGSTSKVNLERRAQQGDRATNDPCWRSSVAPSVVLPAKIVPIAAPPSVAVSSAATTLSQNDSTSPPAQLVVNVSPPPCLGPNYPDREQLLPGGEVPAAPPSAPLPPLLAAPPSFPAPPPAQSENLDKRLSSSKVSSAGSATVDLQNLIDEAFISPEDAVEVREVVVLPSTAASADPQEQHPQPAVGADAQESPNVSILQYLMPTEDDLGPSQSLQSTHQELYTTTAPTFHLQLPPSYSATPNCTPLKGKAGSKDSSGGESVPGDGGFTDSVLRDLFHSQPLTGAGGGAGGNVDGKADEAVLASPQYSPEKTAFGEFLQLGSQIRKSIAPEYFEKQLHHRIKAHELPLERCSQMKSPEDELFEEVTQIFESHLKRSESHLLPKVVISQQQQDHDQAQLQGYTPSSGRPLNANARVFAPTPPEPREHHLYHDQTFRFGPAAFAASSFATSSCFHSGSSSEIESVFSTAAGGGASHTDGECSGGLGETKSEYNGARNHEQRRTKTVYRRAPLVEASPEQHEGMCSANNLPGGGVVPAGGVPPTMFASPYSSTPMKAGSAAPYHESYHVGGSKGGGSSCKGSSRRQASAIAGSGSPFLAGSSPGKGQSASVFAPPPGSYPPDFDSWNHAPHSLEPRFPPAPPAGHPSFGGPGPHQGQYNHEHMTKEAFNDNRGEGGPPLSRRDRQILRHIASQANYDARQVQAWLRSKDRVKDDELFHAKHNMTEVELECEAYKFKNWLFKQDAAGLLARARLGEPAGVGGGAGWESVAVNAAVGAGRTRYAHAPAPPAQQQWTSWSRGK